MAITLRGTKGSSLTHNELDANFTTLETGQTSAVAITGGTITGITDLAVADGGTGASTPADARTALGLGSGTIAAKVIDNGNAAFSCAASTTQDLTFTPVIPGAVIIDWYIVFSGASGAYYGYSLLKNYAGGIKYDSAPGYSAGYTVPATPTPPDCIIRVAANSGGTCSGTLYWFARQA